MVKGRRLAPSPVVWAGELSPSVFSGLGPFQDQCRHPAEARPSATAEWEASPGTSAGSGALTFHSDLVLVRCGCSG